MSENEKRSGDEIDRWPEDEAPASEAERAAAARFKDALERPAEPADPEQAELRAAAAMLRAAAHEQHLEPGERDRLLEAAIGEGLRAARPTRGLRRLAPALALAASVLILIGSLVLLGRGQLSTPRLRPRSEPQPQILSRSSDDLIGRPFEDRAGAARRLDLVFADRLAGYRRARLLASGGGR